MRILTWCTQSSDSDFGACSLPLALVVFAAVLALVGLDFLTGTSSSLSLSSALGLERP